MVMRAFTKEDWYGYAGAEKFSNGEEPLIGQHSLKDEHVEVSMICSKNQINIEVYCETTEDEDSCSLQSPTEKIGKLIANQIFESVSKHDNWVDCQTELRDEYGINLELDTSAGCKTLVGTYVISNCLVLQIYTDTNDNWFVRRLIENNKNFEVVQFIPESIEGKSGLMWGDLFIDLEEVQWE